MSHHFFLLVLATVGAVRANDDPDSISVPKDVFKFILGCQRQETQQDVAVPVFATDVSDKDKTTSQHVSLLNMDELSHSLRQTVSSDVVLDHIMEQVQDAVDSSVTRARSDCNVQTRVQVELPLGEVEDIKDQMQTIIQQGRNILLQQINNLFTYKLRTQRLELEKTFKRKFNQVNNKLNKILMYLGDEDIHDEPDDLDEMLEEDTTDSSFMVFTGEPDSSSGEVTTLAPQPGAEVQQSTEPASEDIQAPAQPDLATEATSQAEPQRPVSEFPPNPVPETVPPSPTPSASPLPCTTCSDESSSSTSNESPEILFERVAQKPQEFSSNFELLTPLVHRRRQRPSNQAQIRRPVNHEGAMSRFRGFSP